MKDNKINIQNEDGISTKKSFLITLPKKKKNDATPIIQDAKTINHRNDAPAEKFERGRDGSRENNSNANASPFASDKNHRSKQKPQKNRGGKSNAPDRAADKNVQADFKDNLNRPNGQNSKNNKDSKDSKDSKGKNRKHHEQASGNNRNKPAGENAEKAVANENKQYGDIKKNSKKHNKNRRGNRDKHPALSENTAPAKEIQESRKQHKPDGTERIGVTAASEHSHFTARANTSRFTPEISYTSSRAFTSSAEEEKSLEAKYKNAPTLREIIENEQNEQKRIKERNRPCAAPSGITGGSGQEASEGNQGNQDNMIEIVGIRFREAGKIYYFDPDGQKINFGTPVIVETARGSEYGFTAISNRFIPASDIVPPLKKLERVATKSDTQQYISNKNLEEEASKVFKEKIKKHNLEMSLISVEYTFDNSKLLFYFTAEGRIDFRELVKDLASVFHTRIELRQIGVRDEAKMLGGLGVCGRGVCCNTFLGDFTQVSIKMAKDQSLSLNSAKISGSCGRLMCCLRYEEEAYETEGARTPAVNAIVETPEGKGIVVERNALRGIVTVSLEGRPDAAPSKFSADEVRIVGYAKHKEEHDEELKALEKDD